MTNGDDLIHSFNDTSEGQGFFRGLKKREYFAAMAMQGILASNRTQKTETSLSKLAVYYADELIKALNENQ